MHVLQSSTVSDHCRAYALSDPDESVFQVQCDHEHEDGCERCDLISSTLDAIDAALDAHVENFSPAIKEELFFTAKQARTNINAWKAHILRSANQDAARVDILESLDESSVLVVQDWAMKFLPRKYRESQTDWFGKRGIPWHISVAFRRHGEHIQMLTLTHIFQASSQDSCAVIAIMKDVIKQLKSLTPNMKTVYFRQYNAGCYHC